MSSGQMLDGVAEQAETLPRRGLLRRIHRRAAIVCLVLLVATIALLCLSLTLGSFPISTGTAFSTLFGGGTSLQHFIVIDLRLPRAIAAVLIGMGLGASGAMFQSVSRNPLGSPDIIGLTAGASAGAVLVILVFSGGRVEITFGALVGGIGTALVVYAISHRGGVQGYRLVLVGIGVAAMLNALTYYLLLQAKVSDAQGAYVWLVGNLNGADWSQVWPLLIALGVLLPAAVALRGRMHMLEMGDDLAAALGVRVEATRRQLIAVGTLLAACATAMAGPVAFVALSAPQIALRLTKRYSVGILSSAILGGFLLLVSDLVAQHLLASGELPVGVVTVSVGGVYLIALLYREARRNRA